MRFISGHGAGDRLRVQEPARNPKIRRGSVGEKVACRPDQGFRRLQMREMPGVVHRHEPRARYSGVDDGNRAAFSEAESFPPPLNYKKQGEIIDLSFWRAPERLFDEPDELVEWARAALAAAHRVAAKTKRKSRQQTV